MMKMENDITASPRCNYERPEIVELTNQELTDIAFVWGTTCLPEFGGGDIGGEDGGGDL